MEETIGERVRRLRKAKDWTQVALAYNAGRAPSVVSQVETGNRDPELSTIKKFADALEVDWRYLLLGDQLPKAPAPSASGPRSGAGDEDSGDELIPLDVGLQRIQAAGEAAYQASHDWRLELERSLEEGRSLAKYRALEMFSFHNELSRLFLDNFKALLNGARQGIAGVVSEGVSQYLDPDPALWPPELKGLLHEAGARIAELPKIIEEIERAAAEQGLGVAERSLHEGIRMDSPHEELSDALAGVGA